MKSIFTFEDVILQYEYSLTIEFSKAGFKYAVYTDLYPECEFLQIYDESVYSAFCFHLLRDCQFPILKKRDGVSIFNPQTVPALEYISKYYDYNLDMLWKNARRTLKKARLFTELEPFYNKYRSIYLYGSGKIALEIETYFTKQNWRIAGYLETTPQVNEKKRKASNCLG